MSDWSMFEIEDITLDGLGDNCDRLVPHNGAGQVNDFEAQGDTQKKARHGVLNLKERNIDNKDSTKDIFYGNQETTFHPSLTYENSQSVNCLPSRASKSVFAFSYSPKCMDAITTFASDDTRTLDGYFSDHEISTHGDGLFSDEPTLRNTSVANEGKLSHFSLEMSPSETVIDLQMTDSKIGENSDIMDYDWPDVGSFDDVDKMLSYGTFGQGSSGNLDELSWLSSSSYTVDGSEDAFKLGLQSSYSDLNALDSLQTDTVIWPDNGLQTVAGDKVSSLDYDSFTNWFEADVQDKVDFPSKRNVIMTRDEEKNQLDKKENVNTSEYASGSTCPVHDTVAQHDNKVYLSTIGEPKTSLCHYTGSHIQYMEPENSGSSHSLSSEGCIPLLGPTAESNSTIKSLKEAKPPLLIHIPVEASKNGHQSLKILSPLSNSPTAIAAKKIEKMHLEQHPHTEVPIGCPNQKPLCFSGLTNQDSSNKKLYEVKTPVGRNNHIKKCSPEQPNEDIGSISQADSSIAWSGDIPSSRKTFQQLQDVMNQLDMQTKLCIRDGLYRLAKSAEQRHTVDDPKSGCCDNMDSSEHIESDKPKRCHGYIDFDMETSTNLIDRSIVHLLFQRPSEHPSYPAEDAMPHKPLNSEVIA